MSDGTAAVISAAVKAAVRNSFMRLSYTRCRPHPIKEQFIGRRCPGQNWSACKKRSAAANSLSSEQCSTRRGAADRGQYREIAAPPTKAMILRNGHCGRRVRANRRVGNLAEAPALPVASDRSVPQTQRVNPGPHGAPPADYFSLKIDWVEGGWKELNWG